MGRKRQQELTGLSTEEEGSVEKQRTPDSSLSIQQSTDQHSCKRKNPEAGEKTAERVTGTSKYPASPIGIGIVPAQESHWKGS